MRRAVALAIGVLAVASVVRWSGSETTRPAIAPRTDPPIGPEAAPPPASRLARLGLPPELRLELRAAHTVEDFDRPIAQFRSVFWDPEDTVSLRKLIRETGAAKGKAVLEIGTGTGLLALCALKAGAAWVVATDVNPAAIANAHYNAELLGLADRLELRLVPLDDPRAFAVLRPGERFDLVVSNPPWEDVKPRQISEYALYDDNFTLMESLLDGLRGRLNPGGHALLAYGHVPAIREILRQAPGHGLTASILDDRDLDALPDDFLPGMLIRLSPEDAGPLHE